MATEGLKGLGFGLLVKLLALGLVTLGLFGMCVYVNCIDTPAARERAMVRRVTPAWEATVKDAQGVYLPPGTQCRVEGTIRGDGAEKLWTTIRVACGELVLFERELRDDGTYSVRFCTIDQVRAGEGFQYGVKCAVTPSRSGRGQTAAPGIELDTAAGRLVITAYESPMHIEFAVTPAVLTPGPPLFP